MTKHPRLARDIALVIAVKLVALTGLYLAFFGPEHRTAQTPATVAAHLLADGGGAVPLEGKP